jgi:hypothetical protein
MRAFSATLISPWKGETGLAKRAERGSIAERVDPHPVGFAVSTSPLQGEEDGADRHLRGPRFP